VTSALRANYLQEVLAVKNESKERLILGLEVSQTSHNYGNLVVRTLAIEEVAAGGAKY
jgi:hypothetical protein